MKRIFVTDLDGTLFSQVEGLGTEAQARLKKLLREKPGQITFATARSLAAALKCLGQPSFQLPMIAHNGAAFFLPEGALFHCVVLEPDLAQEAAAFFKDRGLPFVAVQSPAEGRDRYWWKPEGPSAIDLILSIHTHDTEFRPLESKGLPDVSTLLITVAGTKEQVDGVLVWAKSRPNLNVEVMSDPYQSGVFCAYLKHQLADKGQALRRLREYLEPQACHVTVFGDGLNDLSLFEAADFRVAVWNACEELKARADLVLGEQQTVLEYLESELGNPA